MTEVVSATKESVLGCSFKDVCNGRVLLDRKSVEGQWALLSAPHSHPQTHHAPQGHSPLHAT